MRSLELNILLMLGRASALPLKPLNPAVTRTQGASPGGNSQKACLGLSLHELVNSHPISRVSLGPSFSQWPSKEAPNSFQS